MKVSDFDGIYKEDYYHRPILCPDCGEVLEFFTIGSYKCPSCERVELDDYGKVREYLYSHPGASVDDVNASTGVKVPAIRQMLREEKITVYGETGKMSMVTCQLCNKLIDSGRMCLPCQQKYNKKIEDKARQERIRNMNISGSVVNNQEKNDNKMRFMGKKD